MPEFLFKYSPVIFKNGSFAFRLWPSVTVLVLLALFTLLLLWLLYRRTPIAVTGSLKYFLIFNKFAAIGLLIFALLEPVVNVSTVVPRKSSLIVLVDDSKSMSITDAGTAETRTAVAKRLLGDDEQTGLLHDLAENFKLQLYRFSAAPALLQSPAGLAADGTSTNISSSLEFASELGSQSAVSGIVLISDGVNNSQADPLEIAARMKPANLPIFTVGIGSETTEDIELAKVVANYSVIENSVIELSALIKSNSVQQKEIGLELKEEGTIIRTRKLTLDGISTRASVKFTPQQQGFIRYDLHIKTGVDEAISENNYKSFIVDSRDKRAKILYVEGRLRADSKYIRRALHADENIQLVSLARTGTDKFYRQGIDEETELQDGFPTEKENLFEYDAIIFGSIEADFFSGQQQEMVVDFVSQRGGGFLMLGGPESLCQGGYAGSVIEKMLPVELPTGSRSGGATSATFLDRFKLQLTPAGLRSPVMQLAELPADNIAAWGALPEIEGYNEVGRAKPGATVLAVHPLGDKNNPKIILARQRFGRGRTMVFATSGSWFWQMGMPSEDMSHQRFWRQITRWLALMSPEKVGINTERDTYVPGEDVNFKVDVRNSSFDVIEDARIKARVQTPKGNWVEVPFTWSRNGTVQYVSQYQPQTEGLYIVEVMAYDSEDNFIGKAESAFFVEDSRLEFSNAQLQSAQLKRIAELSGGKYYHELEAGILPEEISVMESTYSKQVEYDLWDTPALFFLVLLILASEWFIRRSKGLS